VNPTRLKAEGFEFTISKPNPPRLFLLEVGGDDAFDHSDARRRGCCFPLPWMLCIKLTGPAEQLKLLSSFVIVPTPWVSFATAPTIEDILTKKLSDGSTFIPPFKVTLTVVLNASAEINPAPFTIA
jgi:hypothetical protein